MSNSIEQLLQDSINSARRAWDTLADPSIVGEGLHDLPTNVANSLSQLVDKVTNHGTLGSVPNPRDWLPEQLVPSPPPPPPAAPRTPTWLNSVANHAGAHPVAYSLAAAGLTGTASYYLFPRQTLSALTPLTRLVPLTLLPDPKNRPLRLLPTEHGVAGEVRKEAVLVLGADCPAGRELALEMERRGFVVIATVRKPDEVDSLEKLSRGWLKVLVLDANESSSVAPFLRSLSTALSLRFPLYTSGDPFSRPAQALALTGVVNCLSLSAANEMLAPLEAVENDTISKHIGERIVTVVGMVKGLLPILRTAAGRPGAPTGSFVNLVPSASSNLSLPFLSLTSAVNAALSSLFHSLRRELSASSLTHVQLTVLETGFFAAAEATSPVQPPMLATLPIRLEALYAPALRRRAPHQQSEGGSGQKRSGRKGTEVRKLAKRVFKVLVRPANASAIERIGSGSRTYLFVSLLPHSLVDVCLKIQDHLYGLYLSHLSHRFQSLAARRQVSPSRPSRPLPTPPSSQQQHPDVLRPASSAASHPSAPSQVPVADPFVPTPTSPTHHEHEHDAAETSSQSSLEDFGPLGASMSASMGGSFVSVGRAEAEQA
ncbi:hypothetical protein JCM11641_007734 [Rhodosporidiobolus odoratus]